MYIMKISFRLGMIIFAFIFVLFLNMCSCGSYTPYSFSMASKLPQYPYEGFTSYATYPEHKSIDSSESKLIIQSQMGNATKVKGFAGLLVSPNSPEMPLDTYSQAKGDNTCKSYGYMNSTGFLCLNPDQIKQLTTRGGNMSSGDSMIG